MTVKEQIIHLCAKFGLLREGIALANQGKSLQDAERIIALDQKLRRDLKRARRNGGHWSDPF